MNILQANIGAKIELDVINSMGDSLGSTYISQLIDVVDKENIMISAPIMGSRVIPIPVGARVRMIMVTKEKEVVSITGNIVSRGVKDNIISLQTRIYDNFDKVQRRSFYRLEYHLDILYRLAQNDEDNEYKKGISRDLSGNGICLVLDEEVPQDSILEIKANLGNNKEIRFKAQAVRIKAVETKKGKKYEIGAKIKEITNRDQDSIIRFIFEKSRELIKRELK